jgi:c-di-GMP-binding flagellar brake protein YcgR
MDKVSGFNQRQHARVNIAIDMHLVLVDAKAVGLLEGKERINLRKGKISDISVAGLKVKTEDLAQGRHFYLLSGAIVVALKFTLPGHTKSISATAQVMRIVHDEDGKAGECTLGLRFIEIDLRDQAIIATFVERSRLNLPSGK